jgi:hypothetical protein
MGQTGQSVTLDIFIVSVVWSVIFYLNEIKIILNIGL